MVSGNLNMNTRSIINFKEPQPYQSTYAGNVNYVIKTNSDSNANLQISSKLKMYFFIFTVLVTTTKKSSNLITVPLTLSVQAARILLRSIMNWLSKNVEFMKFILEMVVREALQMSC